MRVGGLLYECLRDVREEFGPARGQVVDLAWRDVDAALAAWLNALRVTA